tara:strand:- start:918 stop:1205 length:288 start_codon:yes stop_codon:yes gene_type:complete
MTTIYILTAKRQGQEPQTWYHTTRQEAEENQRCHHEGYLMMHLATANRIKGALRTFTGIDKMSALAAGIVVDNLQYTIHIAKLREPLLTGHGDSQ